MTLILIFVAISAFALGSAVGARHAIRTSKTYLICRYALDKIRGRQPVHNAFWQRIYALDKTTVAAPRQTDRTLVLVSIGQSNMANSVGGRSKAPANVVNFFGGRCYAAVDPLLGTSAHEGNIATLIASRLAQHYDHIILVPMAVGATRIERWTKDLGRMVDRRLSELPYTPTHFLWHHGEADAFRTSGEVYERYLRKIVRIVRSHAPRSTFSVALCSGFDGRFDDSIRRAQLAVIASETGVVRGPDTDAINAFEDRRDGCHFSPAGAAKLADEWAALICSRVDHPTF